MPGTASTPPAGLAQPLRRARAAWQAYRAGALGDDLVAACVVTVLLVPQSLAYAMLAGLPPVVGVMASLLPVLAYAAFGSSTTLAVGPVAVVAMMTAQAVGPVAQASGVQPALAAVVLAAEVALVLGAAALLRLDVLAALLSAPVLHGFISGAALVIALGQLPALLGLPVQGSTAVELARSAAHAADATGVWPHGPTALVGLAALALLAGLRRWGAGLARPRGWVRDSRPASPAHGLPHTSESEKLRASQQNGLASPNFAKFKPVGRAAPNPRTRPYVQRPQTFGPLA